MDFIKRMTAAAVLFFCLSTRQLEAVSYVTDTGGYAYDQSRAATNLAPAIALGTVAVVGVIALAVQNSHDSSSSSSYSHSASGGSYTNSYGNSCSSSCSSSFSSSSSSSSSFPYYYLYYDYSSSSGHF